jgi:hypothetical protein
MSSSFLEQDRQASTRRALLGAALLSGALIAVPTQAAQTYWQPQIEASVEQNTNRNLAIDPANEEDVHGYSVTAEVLWGHVTPRTETRVLPRVRFQRFPDDKDAQRSEQFLDFSTQHRASERSTFDLVGRFSREDTFRTELGGAEFDDFDPDDTTDGADSGSIRGEDTRKRAQLRPGYTYEFSELNGIFIGGVAETVRFDSGSDSINRTDYDYFELRTLLTHRLSPLTRLSAGPVVSRYETRLDDRQTDSYGIELNLDHRWSEVTQVRGGLFVRRSEFDVIDGATTDTESDTDFGANISVTRRTEVGAFRAWAGRAARPSTGGNLVLRDELRLQFDRDFSERLSMRTALRAYTEESKGALDANRDKDYARAELGLKWMLTPTMYIGGRYEYTWRELARDETSGKNHAAILSFGYRGLGRPE